MPLKPKPRSRRAPNFVPQLLRHLERAAVYTGKFSDLPEAYQSQPHNLAAKLKSRGGFIVKIVFNKETDLFCLIKQAKPKA